MTTELPVILISFLDPSWIQILYDLHWDGLIDSYLSKGYASFKLTDDERKKWKLNSAQEDRIRELLQENISEAETNQKKTELLELLGSVESIILPNLQNDIALIDEMHTESDKSNQKLLQIVSAFIDPLLTDDQETLLDLFTNWQGRHLRNIFHKGISLLVELLNQKEIMYSYTTIADIESKPDGLKHFYLILYFYFNKYPDKERIEIFKHYLLKENEILTDCIDGILYRSWKFYPDEMFVLTKEWMDSKISILINWLIHGLENPGRSNPFKAFNFLMPAFYIDNKEVVYITSHVSATILCSEPYKTFEFFESILMKPNNLQAKNILKQSLEDIITDKFVNKNIDMLDFPNLEKIIFNKLQEWSKTDNVDFQEISIPLLDKLYN